MSSIRPTLYLTVAYLIIVHVGMWLMKGTLKCLRHSQITDREPFKLTTLSRVYNIITVLLNAYMVHEARGVVSAP